MCGCVCNCEGFDSTGVNLDVVRPCFKVLFDAKHRLHNDVKHRLPHPHDKVVACDECVRRFVVATFRRPRKVNLFLLVEESQTAFARLSMTQQKQKTSVRITEKDVRDPQQQGSMFPPPSGSRYHQRRQKRNQRENRKKQLEHIDETDI